MRSLLCALAAVIGLVGLQAGCTGGGFKAVEFDIPPMPPLHLNARKLKIINNWRMPVGSPNIGHYQTVPPPQHIIDWASEVLVPAGGSGEFVVDIRRAELTMERLPLKTGVTTLFVDQQDTRIRFEIDAVLSWIQPVGERHARIDIAAGYSVTVPESSTPIDVDAAIAEAIDIAISRLDGEARDEMRKIDRLVLP